MPYKSSRMQDQVDGFREAPETDPSWETPPPYEVHSSGSVLASSAVVNGRWKSRRCPAIHRTRLGAAKSRPQGATRDTRHIRRFSCARRGWSSTPSVGILKISCPTWSKTLASSLVYIGFGSIVLDNATEMTAMLKEACRIAGVRVIISRGWSKLSRDEPNTDSVFYLGDCLHGE
ncbi:UDP-sugar-dependent glycosyltransferase 52 like protein [Verticillium longisporum]|nr:UDP-sugar-dependent glycosyltransferase 52 like protein [Verticillium longisporum]KAG7131871.1 UDP-sugar-dependent glycosyltransferase 52 like protein [Verticillium longisporum]